MTLWSTAKTRALKSIKRLGRAYLEIPRILILIIIMAAASDVNVETTVTPVWEQMPEDRILQHGQKSLLGRPDLTEHL